MREEGVEAVEELERLAAHVDCALNGVRHGLRSSHGSQRDIESIRLALKLFMRYCPFHGS